VTDNGSDSEWQDQLRELARIHDDQTYQDTGDPVAPTIGMVSHSVVDMYIPGRGLDFCFERRYSSALSDANDQNNPTVNGPLGIGWDHCYNARLKVEQGGAVVKVFNGNDRTEVYTWTSQSSHIYNSPPGVYTLFKFVGAPTHILRNRQGVKTYFNGQLLDKIEDPSGNKLSFYYDTSGYLDYVIDTMGRTIDFNHNAQGKLEWIQDFRGRRVEYSYDGNGNLTGVRSPTVTSTSSFNDFPAGRT